MQISPLDSENKPEDEIAPTEQEIEETVRYWTEAHRSEQVREKAKWRAQGFEVAWIDLEPKYLPICDWHFNAMGDEPILPPPQQPCRRTLRFSMLGGGQIALTEHWAERQPLFPGDALIGPMWRRGIALRVTTHSPHLRRWQGHIVSILNEVSTDAVLLRAPAEVAQRVAATLRLLSSATEGSCTPPDRDRFYALLDNAESCALCARPLRDEISKLIGVGPDCAKQNGIPHTLQAANRRLELRRQLLGEVAP
jgi:uncharacterized protein DUF6011